MTQAMIHQFPVIRPEDVSPVEYKYYDFIRSMALTAHARSELIIEPGIVGHTGRRHNRYIFKQGKQSITVDFRAFTIVEIPRNFQHGMIRSPRNRSLIATIKTLGCGDLVASVLTWLNETIQRYFEPGSYMYYAMQEVDENLHAFYYSEKDTENKVVVQIRL